MAKKTYNQEQKSGSPMPKQPYTILLAAGFLSIVVGIVLLFFSFDRFHKTSFFVRPLIVLLLGCFMLYRAFIVQKRALPIFFGMFLSFFGILTLVIDSGVTNLTFYQLWPTVVILCGIALIFSGFYKYERLHPAFLVPSAMLLLMGGFFLLFSLDIIREPLLRVAAHWWPLLLVVAGCIMIGLFVYIQHNRAALFKNGSDEFDEDVG